MNELFLSLGISGWKPVLTALILPPVPWIVLALWGAWLLARRRPVGWLLLLPACASMWLASTTAVGEMLVRTLLSPPAALGPEQIARLKKANTAEPGAWAIVVLGAGREALAPEYSVSNLTPTSLARLRYALWLSRETGIAVAYSGGIGHGSGGTAAEAEVAARIAAQEFNRPIKWQETSSRDTRENASFSVGLLRGQGVRHLVLVTQGWHMPRAQRAFEMSLRGGASPMDITLAPMGLARPTESSWLRWMPSNEGLLRVRDALREALGLAAGA